jgi:hypothetical protein|tara:strand:- start:2281 stop:2460 length:180 start_codon:yes stop_codon:yes gene_type:complete
MAESPAFWRENHDYDGDGYMERVRSRLKQLSKSLRNRRQKSEADELDAMVRSVTKSLQK